MRSHAAGFESGYFSGLCYNYVLYSPPGAPGAAETGLERAGLAVAARERVRVEDAPAKAMAMAVAVMVVALVAMD